MQEVMNNVALNEDLDALLAPQSGHRVWVGLVEKPQGFLLKAFWEYVQNVMELPMLEQSRRIISQHVSSMISDITVSALCTGAESK